MQRPRGMVKQGQVRQVQIIMYGRFESTDEAWKKKVGRSEAEVGGSENQRARMASELWGNREKSRRPRTYWGCLSGIPLLQY